MVQSYSLKSGLLLAIIFPVVNFYVCCKEFQPLKLHRNSLSKVGSQILSSQERIGSGGDRINANVAVQTKLTSLNYDEIQFAYGCLHDIPKPNVTLDTTFTPQQERNVLMEIFNQTAGHNWNNNTQWGNDSVSHCFWYGITCDHTNRYIINIILRKNNLTGTLPRSLWKLRNLQVLCIGNNKELLGDLREILSPNMTTILRLDLSHNRLSGIIPGELLVNMKSLVKIRLCCQMDDGLTGEIPMDIGNLTELQILSLGENRLYGSIPKSIAKLKKLWFLDLETATYLNSGFENLFNLSSLRFMHLSLAGLKGTLPDEFGLYFPEMIECLLAGNHFTGNIPSTMGNMTNLLHLNLARNHLSGEIPKCIGLIPTLQIVNFCGNQLSSFEKGIKFMSLEVLLLASNRQLTMSFNVLLEAMESTKGSLRILSVRDCNFLGTIPAMLWHFKNVIYIDLRNNRLTGKLPWSYSENLLFLHDLHVSANNLSGQIPEPYVDLPSLEVLDVSKNPYMHGSGTLPNYMRVDFTTLTRRHPSDQFKCPNARLNHNNGLVVLDPSYYFYSLCICDIGYYGSGKICLPCMEGAVCEDQMIPAQNMVMKMGFWPSSRHQNVSHLVDCSQALGTSPHINTSCNPTGACDCWIDNEWIKEGDMANIRPSTVCNKSCLCLTGSKDRFCSLCEDGYYKQGILCYACPKTEISVYILAALAVLTLVLITLTFFLYEKKRFLSIVFVFSQIILLAVLAMLRIIPGWLLELNTVVLFVGLAERGKTARGILKISLFYLQTLDALISNNDIWPIEALQTQRYISNVFNFRFSGLACVIPRLFTPLGELVSLVLLPVFCILGIWLWYGLGCLVCTVLRLRNLQVRRFRLRNTCLQLSIVSLNLTYFPIVKKTASVLARCGEDNNYHYLREAPWMECEGHVYTILQVLGWLAFVIYVIGVPLGVLLPLLRIYKVSTRDQLPPEEQETLDSWLGSIYLPYKKEFRSFFEIFFILKRMLIAFSLSLITRASSFQTIAVCFVLLVSLCFQLFFRPFNDSLENTVEALVLLTLHFSFMNIRYAVLNPDSSAPIVWMLVTVNLVLLCGIVVSIIVLLGRKNAEEIPLLMHDRAEDMELTPICQINSLLSSLVRNGPEEQYETFDDS